MATYINEFGMEQEIGVPTGTTPASGNFTAATLGIPMQSPDALFDYLVGKTPATWWDTLSPLSQHGAMKEMAFLEDNAGFKKGLHELFKDPNFLKEAAAGTGASMDTDKLKAVFEKVNTAGPEFQSAVSNALSNPQFLKHMMSGGASDLMSPDAMDSLLEDDMTKGFATQLLNQIGTNPMFKGDNAQESFERLDTLGNKVKALGEQYKALDEAKARKDDAAARKIQEEILKQQMAMADDLRGLGVNVPEDVTPEIKEAFMNILTGRMKTAEAMDQLMLQLAEKGIDPEAIKSLDAMMRPWMGAIDYIAGPYAQFFQKWGPELQSMGANMVAHGEKINDGIFKGVGVRTAEADIRAGVNEISNHIEKRDNPQDAVSAEGQAALDAGHTPVTVTKAEGLDGARDRVDLAETFKLERDAEGRFKVPEATAEKLAEMDALYAERLTSRASAFTNG
jgi:hypothetical protein